MFDTLGCLQCPDCESIVPVAFSLLVAGHSAIVHLACCAKCNDHATIRVSKEIPPAAYNEALQNGLLVVRYSTRSP